MTIYLQKEVKYMQKQPSYIKRVQRSKSLGQKSEIKGGGHEMAAIMLIINVIMSMHKAILKFIIHIIAAISWPPPLISQLFHPEGHTLF